MTDTSPAADRFFFIHVMKTGGTSFVQHHLDPAFTTPETFPNREEDTLEFSFDQSDYWLVPAVRGIDAERHARLRLYRGHYPYCALDAVPQAGLTTLTMLRDPVDRAISYLKHCKKYHPIHRDMTLEQIYDERDWMHAAVENHQTKVFSMTQADEPKWILQPFVCDEERLELAKANLRSVDLVGVQERFDAFVAECGRRFGWPTERGQREREGQPADVPDSLRDRIEADNQIDRRFYEFATSIAV